MMAETLILVDGNALVHRAFHALQPLTTRKGELVNAVYGFATMLLKAISELRPRYVAVAFDLPAPTFRHQEFQAYKAQRAKGSEELYQQFRRVRQLVTALNFPSHEIEGFEADDVLGTLARQATARGLETVILTGDSDALQLVAPDVRVLTPRKGVSDTVLYDEAAVRDRYGVSPAQLADLKALVGDISDNIPGVPGIGEKTAAKLLGQFGTVEQLQSRLDEVDPKLRGVLDQRAAQIALSKHLATIVTDIPVTLDLARCRVGSYDREAALALLRELEFRSLLGRLPAVEPPAQEDEARQAPAGPPAQMSLFDQGAGFSARTPPLVSPVATAGDAAPLGRYEIVDTWEALDALISRLAQAPGFALDTETDSKEEMRAKLVGISLSPAPGEAFYIPLGHLAPADEQPPRQLPAAAVLERLRGLLEDRRWPKYAHNAKYDLTVLARHGVAPTGCTFDTMLAAYVLRATQRTFGLKDLAFSTLGIEMTPISALIGSGRKQLTMAEVPIAAAAAYACADADMTYRLVEALEPELRREGLWRLFSEVEMPLVPVLSRMERVGVALDVPYLRRLSDDLRGRIADLETQIYESVGHRFNVNSTQQLAQVLFSELRLDTKRKTKVGESTAADVLESLRGAHAVVDLILAYRQLVKLKSTYVDALPLILHPETGRLHTSFNQTGTVTGRLSSSDPNLQNIPIRTELGRQVRRAFIAGDPDSVLLSADYSQIELRIMAHITKDPHLVAAFAGGEDIHAATASEIFGVPMERVNPEMRRMAKTINFGVIYGISDYGLAERIGMPRREAADFIEKYLGRYEGVRHYIERTKRQVEEHGYVATLLNRRRSIPEINIEHRGAREAALRTAINAPIQGSAADIIKLAMIRLDAALGERDPRCKMILQVHDELVFEIPAAQWGDVAPLVKAEMEGAMALDVPLVVDVKTGRNWAEME